MSEYNGKIIDCHVHIFEPFGVKQVIELEQDYDGFCLLSLEAMKSGQNDLCFGVSQKTGCTVFASLNHNSKNFVEQAEAALKRGAKGFKMIEGKPSVYKDLGLDSLASEPFMRFYEFLEEKNVPLLLHAGDPPEFWNAPPDWAKEAGWDYNGEGFPSLEKIQAEVYEILKAFPDLKIILAHFFFIADNIEAAMRLLDEYPCAMYDICPGTEMYAHFSKEPEEWRKFFIKYKDRILFGTDNCETETQEESFDKIEIKKLIHNFLQEKGEFKVWNSMSVTGIDLPQSVLEKIYYENFKRIINT